MNIYIIPSEKYDVLKDKASSKEPQHQSAILFTWNFCLQGKYG